MPILIDVDMLFPHCSLVAYVADSGATRIFMATRRQTRKYPNLIRHSSVSRLTDTRGREPRASERALTVNGDCRPIEDEKHCRLVYKGACCGPTRTWTLFEPVPTLF